MQIQQARTLRSVPTSTTDLTLPQTTTRTMKRIHEEVDSEAEYLPTQTPLQLGKTIEQW